jgi:acyl-coenzyme A synthetase/AMP-(fatty) acid ligase
MNQTIGLQPSVAPPRPDFAPTLPNLVHDAARRYGERDYMVMDERRISFAEAEAQSAAWAKGLLALGVGKGTRVGLLMPNCPDWVLAFFACARAGAHTVSLSTFFQAPEISWGVRHNDLDTLLIADSYLGNDYIERLERGLPGLKDQTTTELYLPEHPFLRRIVVFGDCDRPWAMKGAQSLVDAARSRPQIDDAFLARVEANVAPADWLITICTSGTTAEPKAVVHTHGVAVRTVWIYSHYIDLLPDDRTYTGQAFFWIGGLNMNLIPSLFRGACLCFSISPKPADVVAMMVREKVTRLSLWPAQVAGLAQYAEREGVDLSFIRSGLSGPRDEAGQLIPPERRVGGMMGMTECFGMHSIEKQTTAAPPGKTGHWGRRVPGVERRVVDPVTKQDLPPGQTGELYIRGHTLMQGYYKREREEVFTRDGWFATGDLAAIDEDGYIYFHGRHTEMIKTSGANVSPKEVEVALMGHPAVREAIVFGMPEPIKGEVVVAVIVPADGQSVEAPVLQGFLRDQVSPYKIPHEIVFMSFDEIPRTGSQKARKRDLAQMLGARATPIPQPDQA